MNLRGVNLVQRVSNSKVMRNDVLCFRNKIENKSNEKILNIVLKNNISVDFFKKYYEFEKSRDDIEIYNDKGDIKIEALLPGDEVIIYTSVVIEDDIESEVLKSYSSIIFKNEIGTEYDLKSNENIVEIIKNNGMIQTSFNIEVNKRIIDEEDDYKLKVIISNDGVIPIKDVELIDLIPSEAEFVKDSLYINKSFINIGRGINSVKLGEILPTQRIEVELRLKLNKIYNKENIENQVVLSYSYFNDKGFEERVSKESNVINLELRKAQIVNFKKIASKNDVRRGEEINFTITCKNNGNVKLYDLEFLDQIGEGFSYIEDSFFINGRKADRQKHNILKLDFLDIGEEISYEYKCIALKNIEDNNVVLLKYKYLGSDENKIFEKEIVCECDRINIKYADIKDIIKTIDKDNMFIGEEAECEIILKNKGNLTAENIIIKDYLNSGVKLLENTIYINDMLYENNDLSNIRIDKIYSREEIKIKYKIVATDIIEKENSFNNKICSLNYSYFVDEEKIEEEKKFENINITINGAIIKNLKKVINKVYASLDDEIDIKLSFENAGNYIAEDIFIKENYNSSMVFVEGSLKINGKSFSYDIDEGFILGDVNPNEYIEISYKLKIIRIPYNDITLSTTNIIYESISTKEGIKISNMLVSQSETIKIKSANINFENGLFIREVDKNTLELGECARFRIFFRNNGNVKAENVILNEVIENFKIVDNKVWINGSYKKIINGTINIGTVNVQEEIEIIYDAMLIAKKSLTVNTLSTLKYSYYLQDSSKIIKKEGKSNLVEVKGYNSEIVFINDSIKSSIELDEVFDYNLYISNKSELNLYDIKTSFEVEKAVEIEVLDYKINNVRQNVQDLTQESYIDEFDKNRSILVTIKLKVKNTSGKANFYIQPLLEGIFYDGMSENIIKKRGEKNYINIESYSLKVFKKTARDTYIKDEVVDYLITIINDGMQSAENILIEDKGLFSGKLEGKILLDGRALSNMYISGIPIEKLDVGESINIRYSIKYDDNTQSKLSSKVKVSADFIKDEKIKKYEFYSNTHELSIKNPNLKITRNVNKENLVVGEKVRFLTAIENIGDLDLYDLEMEETNLESLTKREVYINSLLVDGEEKITIPRLKIGESYEIVTEYVHKEKSKRAELRNKAIFNYKYNGVNKKIFKETKESNKVILKINSEMFKNLNIQHKVYLGNLDGILVSEITDVNIESVITDQYIVKTIKNKKNPNNIATGKKLMIRGYLKEKIEYIAKDEIESLNLYIHKENFTTSLVLSENTDESNKFRINSKVVNVSHRLLNSKFLLNNINMILDVF